MGERHVYAHWLDTDYCGRITFPAQQLEENQRQFETLLKMHALAGDCMQISDVQLVESRVLLLAFADPGFRTFIKQHPDFLRLIARPTGELGATSDRLARICSGLARISAFGDSYIPNTFEGTSVVPGVAGLFKGIKTEADAEKLFREGGGLLALRSRYKGQEGMLTKGLSYALEHFLTNPFAPVPQVSLETSSSYYQVLEGVRDNIPYEEREARNQIEQTLLLANGKEERFRRSLVLAKLPHTDLLGHPDRMKYLTIIQAWNVAVGQSVKADCDSAFCFRNAFPVPVHSGMPIGRATFTVTVGSEVELFKSFHAYRWHPSQLNWKTIAKIRAAFTEKINAYQGSVGSSEDPLGELDGGAQEANFSVLAKVAGNLIAEDRSWMPPIPSMSAPLLTVASYLVGGIASAVLGTPLKPTIAGIPGAGVGAYSTIRAALVRRDSLEISRSLQQFGLQYNLHRSAHALKPGD